MAVIQGTRYTWSDTTNEAIDMTSALDSLHPTDVPFLMRIGKSSLRKACTAVKHEWLEEDIRGQTSTVQDNPLTNVATTLNVATGDGTKFRADDVLILENELVTVTAVATDALTIIRGAGGSSAVQHAQGTVVTLESSAKLQGADPGEARTVTKAGRYNYTQIFEETVKATATMQATDKWTAQNDVEHQIGIQLEVLATNFEKALLFGRKAQGTSSVRGMMDGVRAVLSTNVYDKSGAALTQAMWEDAAQDVWTYGGHVILAVANAIQHRRIGTFLDPYRDADYQDEVFGAVITRYKTIFGTVELMLDRWMPTNEILLLNPELIGFGPLTGRALGITKLPPKSREYDVWQMSGEYTSETRLEKSHARIYNLATTGLF